MIKPGNNIVYLLLGSNRGDKIKNLKTALDLIAENAGEIDCISTIYLTEPWGFYDKEHFLNQAVRIKTSLTPVLLLEKTNGIEKLLGRRRQNNTYESRTIDIDILFYDDLVLNSNNLKIPHPFLQERKFALVPLAEIAGEFVHPVFRRSIKQLLIECTDQGQVEKVKMGE